MDSSSPGEFSDRLLAWWNANGRQDLPWQHPRTPYRVWVSEIMLQQTQVATVIPYFERWMATFPDLPALAKAQQDEVLALWSGLGYYARARNLHKAARICADRHGAQLPLCATELESLPGIGQSTANAIVSQSTDQPAAVLDGNVRRLLARHAAIEGWTGSAAVQKRLWQEAEHRLPERRGADYTQAVMDLGAMVCTRSKPACSTCPVSGDCAALARQWVDRLPTPKPAVKVSDKTLHMLILQDEHGRVLLERRPPAGIWGGLWCLPSGDDLEAIASGLGISIGHEQKMEAIEHRLSHLRLKILPARVTTFDSGQVKCSGRMDWFDPGQLNIGLPRPVADLLSRLNNGEFE